MKTKTLICAALATSLFTGGAFADDRQSKLEAQAKVSKVEAEKIALAKVPGGKIKDAEIEKEDGRLIWSFDIAKEGTKKLIEVEVDANAGEIIDSGDEDEKDADGDKDDES